MSRERVEYLREKRKEIESELADLEKALGLVERKAAAEMPTVLPPTGKELADARAQILKLEESLKSVMTELSALKAGAETKKSSSAGRGSIFDE